MFIKDKNQGDDTSSLKRSERNDEAGGSLSCYGVKERNHSLPETKGEEKHRNKAHWPREMECYSRGLHSVHEERQSRSAWARSLEARDNVWALTSGIPLSQNLR